MSGGIWVKVYPDDGGGSVGAAVVSGSSGATQTTETWNGTTYTVYTFTEPVTAASVALTDEAKERITDEDILRAVAQATTPEGLIAEYGDVLKDETFDDWSFNTDMLGSGAASPPKPPSAVSS